MGDFFYTTPTQFAANATDQSFSNYFYQMSRNSANPFRVTFGYLPKRVNISYAANPSLFGATDAVVAQAIAANPTFNWQDYDQRTNRPNFAFDNSTSAPDGKLDYVVVVWRTYGSCGVGQGAGSGYAGQGVYANPVIPANGSRPALSITDGHVQTGLDRGVFLHEFAHNLYNAPHHLGANGVAGSHFATTQGWGMMSGIISTLFSSNAWERWYNGWTELKTGATQVSSDIQDAASLTATGGIYTLRDYVKTGDVMRLKIPNTNQYVWLENHAFNGPFDQRNQKSFGLAGDGLPFLPPPSGLLAMVEDYGTRSTQITYNQCVADGTKGNRLRTLSAEGNFDYVASGAPAAYNNHLYGNLLYNFITGTTTPGGQNQISDLRFDRNGDNVINYTNGAGNGGMGLGNEGAWQFVRNGTINDGTFGPNIGSRTVGSRYGLDGPAQLTASPYYDDVTKLSTETALNGLSVQITGFNSANGEMTVQVRYNDTDIRPSTTRWAGQLRTYPVAGATNGAEISVGNGRRLTLERGVTAQRGTLGANGGFVNDTRLTISSNTKLLVASASYVDLRGAGTTLFVEPSASVYIGGGGKITAYAGTTISLNNRADLAGSGELKAGAQMIIRSTGQVFNTPMTW